MMWLLGLAVTTVYVPGVTGAVIPSGWLLLSLVLPLFMFKPMQITLAHWLGFAFLLYAGIAIAWARDPLVSVEQLWHFIVLGMAFCLGSRLASLRGMLIGLGIGMTLSGMVAVAQMLGFTGVWQLSAPAGLFYTPNVMSETAALVIVALATERLWWLVLACSPALLLGQSRTAIVALGVCVVLFVRSARIWLGAGIVAAIALFLKDWSSVHDRFDIWRKAPLELLGSGAFFLEDREVYHVFNDPLELVSMYGVGSIFLFATFALALVSSREMRPILVCFAVLSLAAFPLFLPASGFLVALTAGHASRSLLVDGWDRVPSRYDLHPSLAGAKS